MGPRRYLVGCAGQAVAITVWVVIGFTVTVLVGDRLQGGLAEDDPARASIGLAALAVGVVAASVGGYFTVRWLRRSARDTESPDAEIARTDPLPTVPALPESLMRGGDEPGSAAVPRVHSPDDADQRPQKWTPLSPRYWVTLIGFVAGTLGSFVGLVYLLDYINPSSDGGPAWYVLLAWLACGVSIAGMTRRTNRALAAGLASGVAVVIAIIAVVVVVGLSAV